MKNRRFILTHLTLALLSVVPMPRAATIDSIVSEVMASNPELRFYRAEVDAAKGERRTASAWANPELSAQVGRKETRGGGIRDEGMAWAVSLQQTFEWPGRVSLRKAIANRQVELAQLGLRQFEATLAARARTLAYSLFVAQERMSATAEVADRFRQLREVFVQRDPAGLTPVLETRILEATELTLKRRLSETEATVQSALLELNQLRGTAWGHAVRIDPIRFEFVAPPDQAGLAAAMRTNNFELRARQAELEQQGLQVSLARSERHPALTAGPYFSQERAGERERQMGIALSVPLPLWNRNRGNVQTAEARQKQSEASLFTTRRNIERQVVEQALLYESKHREMERWRPDSVDAFREAASLADRHYRLGAVPIATYVELQKQYLEAVDALLETRREALEAAQKLELLTGVRVPVVGHPASEEKP